MSRFQFYSLNGINTVFFQFSLIKFKSNELPYIVRAACGLRSLRSEQQQETIQHRKTKHIFQVTNIEKNKINRSEAPPIAWIREPYFLLIKTKTWHRA